MWWGERDPGARITEADRLLMKSLTAYEDDLCACGHPRAEAWSAEHDPKEPDHTGYYESGAPFRCHACTALAQGQQRYEKEATEAKEPGRVAGAYFVAEFVPRNRLAVAQ